MKHHFLIAAATLALAPALTAIPAPVLAQGTGTPMSAEPDAGSESGDNAAKMPGGKTEMAPDSAARSETPGDTSEVATDSPSRDRRTPGGVQVTLPDGVTKPLIRAHAVEEATVYSLSGAYDETFWDSGEPFAPVMTAWDEIGEVQDLVLDNAAQVVGVTVDVGGFLGIGESTVLIPLDEMRLVQMPEDEGFFIVTRMSEDQLKDAEEVGSLVGDN